MGVRLRSEKTGVTEMCVDLINLSFQMCFDPAICKVSSCRGCVFMQIYAYACIYAHREAIDLVLENRNEEWTISPQLMGFVFPLCLISTLPRQ